MPTFDFDITERAVEYMAENIRPMAGNEGQTSLIESLIEDSDYSSVVSIRIAGTIIEIDNRYDIDLKSSHPDAIEDIMDKAEQYFQEYSERASDILGLIDEAFNSL